MSSRECVVCFAVTDPVTSTNCISCNQIFCYPCILYWQISQRVSSCPHCRTTPWQIALPDLASPQHGCEGFIRCPACQRLGCLRCHNPACRVPLDFERVSLSSNQPLLLCSLGHPLEKFRASDHTCSGGRERSNRTIQYYFCSTCDEKYCGCHTGE
jgi:hypothetical protein